MASLVDANLKMLINEVKHKICAVCQKNINKEFAIQLPCGCNACDKICATKIFKVIFNKEKDFRDGKITKNFFNHK